MTQIRQMTTDFFVADAISPKAIPVIPTVLSRHPDRHSTSSRPPLHVIPTEVEGSLNKLEMTYEAFRDPSTSLRVTGKCMALATKNLWSSVSSVSSVCHISPCEKALQSLQEDFAPCEKALQSLQEDFAPREGLCNRCKMISRRAKGSAIIARRFRAVRRALQSLQNDFAPREKALQSLQNNS